MNKNIQPTQLKHTLIKKNKNKKHINHNKNVISLDTFSYNYKNNKSDLNSSIENYPSSFNDSLISTDQVTESNKNNYYDFLKPRKISQSNNIYLQIRNEVTTEEDLKNLYSTINNISYNLSKSHDNDNVSPIYDLNYLIKNSFKEKSSNMKQKKKKLKKIIENYRQIKSDGNCYYRAVMFRYIEIIILNCDIVLFKKIICDMYKSFNSHEIKERLNIKNNFKFKPDLHLKIMFILCDYLEKGDIIFTHGLFIKCILSCAAFDYGLILYFRYILYDYIKQNENKLYLQKFPIKIGNLLPKIYENELGKFDFRSFYDNNLLKMFVDAEKIIIYLTPFVIKTNIEIILFDDNEDPIIKNIKIDESDDEKKFRISLLNKNYHYEIIYNREDNEKYGTIYEKYKNKNSVHFSEDGEDVKDNYSNFSEDENIDNRNNEKFSFKSKNKSEDNIKKIKLKKRKNNPKNNFHHKEYNSHNQFGYNNKEYNDKENNDNEKNNKNYNDGKDKEIFEYEPDKDFFDSSNKLNIKLNKINNSINFSNMAYINNIDDIDKSSNEYKNNVAESKLTYSKKRIKKVKFNKNISDTNLNSRKKKINSVMQPFNFINSNKKSSPNKDIKKINFNSSNSMDVFDDEINIFFKANETDNNEKYITCEKCNKNNRISKLSDYGLCIKCLKKYIKKFFFEKYAYFLKKVKKGLKLWEDKERKAKKLFLEIYKYDKFILNDYETTLFESIKVLNNLYFIYFNENINHKELFLTEIKKEICIYCMNKVDEFAIKLPCGCYICNSKELYDYFKKSNILKPNDFFKCFCLTEYKPIHLYILCQILNDFGYEDLIQICFENYNLHLKQLCSGCGLNVPKKKIDYYTKGKLNNELSLEKIGKLVHYLCQDCINKYKYKNYFCYFCKKIHSYIDVCE